MYPKALCYVSVSVHPKMCICVCVCACVRMFARGRGIIYRVCVISLGELCSKTVLLCNVPMLLTAWFHYASGNCLLCFTLCQLVLTKGCLVAEL